MTNRSPWVGSAATGQNCDMRWEEPGVVRAQHPRPLTGAVPAALVAAAVVAIGGCGSADDTQPGAGAEETRSNGAEGLDDVYIGRLDAEFHEEIDEYALQIVTLLADVEDVLSPRSFTVTSPDDPEVGPLLVLATRDAGNIAIRPHTTLLMAVTPLHDLQPDEVVEDLRLDLHPDDLADWEGQTFLVATVLQPAR